MPILPTYAFPGPRPRCSSHIQYQQTLSSFLLNCLSLFQHVAWFPHSQVLPFSLCSLSTSLPLLLIALFPPSCLSLQLFSLTHAHFQLPQCLHSSCSPHAPGNFMSLLLRRFLTQSGNTQWCSALSLIPLLGLDWGKLSIKKNPQRTVKDTSIKFCRLCFSV